MNIVEQLLDWKADGIISDCKWPASPFVQARGLNRVLPSLCDADPNDVRRLVKHRGLPVAPKYPKQRVLSCLSEHLAKQLPSRR